MESVHPMRLRTVRPKSDEDEEEPTFRFGDFPAELRNHVYECAAQADRKLAVSEESATGVRALAQVSKLHRKECVAVIQDRAIKEPSTIVVKVIDFDFTEAMRATDRLLIRKASVESFPSDGILPKLLLQFCTTSRHDGDIQKQIRGVEHWLRFLRKLDEAEKLYDEYYGYEIGTIVFMGEALDIMARVDMFLKTSGHFSILHSILYTWEAKQNDAQERRSRIIEFYEDGPEGESDDDEEYEPEGSDAEQVEDLGEGMEGDLDEGMEEDVYGDGESDADGDDEGDWEDVSEDEEAEAEEPSVESLVDLDEGVPTDFYDYQYFRVNKRRIGNDPEATRWLQNKKYAISWFADAALANHQLRARSLI